MSETAETKMIRVALSSRWPAGGYLKVAYPRSKIVPPAWEDKANETIQNIPYATFEKHKVLIDQVEAVCMTMDGKIVYDSLRGILPEGQRNLRIRDVLPSP